MCLSFVLARTVFTSEFELHQLKLYLRPVAVSLISLWNGLAVVG